MAIKFKLPRALLNIYIELPYFHVHTTMMCERVEACVFEYSRFEIKLFKWKFAFSLYETLRSRYSREVKNG